MNDEVQVVLRLDDLGNYQLSRRRLLQLTGNGAAGLAGASLIAACGGPSNNTMTPSTGPISIQPHPNGNGGGARQLATYYLGYNAEPINSPSWDNPTFAQAVAQFMPATLRYPGGTVANYWDWKTGWFLTSSQRFQNNPGSKYGLSELQTAVKTTGAIPIYVLNMLTSTLDDQLELLRTASSMGLPVQLIELGNELNLTESDNEAAYPTAQDYGTAASQWITAIRAEFPNVRLAAVGAIPDPSQGGGRRRLKWNQDVLQTLQGADALVFHPYTKPGLIADETANDTQGHIGSVSQQQNELSIASSSDGPAKIVGALISKWQFLTSMLQAVPTNLNAWFTEYNLNDRVGPIRGTWIHGLFAASQTLTFLEEPRVELVDYYDTIGNAGFEVLFPNSNAFSGVINAVSTTPYALTAPGLTMRLLSETMHGMNSAQQITFNPNPQLDAGNGLTFDSLQGWAFSNGSQKKAYLINRSSSTFTASASAFLPGATQFQQLATSPLTKITGPQSLTPKSGSLQGQLGLPAYSVTQLK